MELTRSLVDGGFLEFDARQSLYRLAPVYLSLNENYQQGRAEFASVLPVLRERARQHSVNLGLLVRDGLHMVYLASFRESRGPVTRVVKTGSRIPIESYASRHALIAMMPTAARLQVLDQLAAVHGAVWPALRKHIQKSISQCKRVGYCKLNSVPGLVAIATALPAPDDSLCALVLTTTQANEQHCLPNGNLSNALHDLAQEIQTIWGGGGSV